MTDERKGASGMTDEQRFFLYLLECYACEKQRPTADVLQE